MKSLRKSNTTPSFAMNNSNKLSFIIEILKARERTYSRWIHKSSIASGVSTFRSGERLVRGRAAVSEQSRVRRALVPSRRAILTVCSSRTSRFVGHRERAIEVAERVERLANERVHRIRSLQMQIYFGYQKSSTKS